MIIEQEGDKASVGKPDRKTIAIQLINSYVP